jgi:ribokinase
MTLTTPRICVVGSINVDTTYRLSSLPAPGETALAAHSFVAPGGKGANQATAAAVSGSETVFVGCVGEDEYGRMARHSLAAAGVDVSHLVSVPDAPTGTAVLLVDDEGENVIVVDPGANHRIDPAALAAHLPAAQYDVILVQLEVNLDAVVAAAGAKGTGALIVNPAPMPASRDLLDHVLAHADVLVPNRPELARLAGTPVPRDAFELDQCVARLDAAGAVVVTLGSAGAAVYAQGSRGPGVLVDPVLVDSVDTTGAGDAFCGAFAHFFARDGDVLAAARRANELAALSTTVRGARITPELVAAADRRPASGAPVRSS